MDFIGKYNLRASLLAFNYNDEISYYTSRFSTKCVLRKIDVISEKLGIVGVQQAPTSLAFILYLYALYLYFASTQAMMGYATRICAQENDYFMMWFV